MFIFLTNDKPVTKIVRYGIIFLVLVQNIPHIDYLKLIQGLKNSARCVRSYTNIYLTCIHTSNIKN